MKSDNRYVPFLDGFRGYAILLVIIGHFYRDIIKIAQFGVTLFFFVSGFLITKLLIYEYDKANTVHLKEFYLRRFFRLYPALLFMLLISVVVILTYGYPLIITDILAGIFYFTNYFLVYFKPVLPAENYPLVSGVLWSLSVEEHFYLLFPFLFLLLFGKKNGIFSIVLLVLLFLFLIVKILVFTQVPYSDATRIIYFTTHCRVDSILFGCLAAIWMYSGSSQRYMDALKSKAIAIVALIVLLLTELMPFPFFQNTLKYTLEGICFLLIIPGFQFREQNGWMRRIVENKVMTYVGKLSYSLYLFHWVARAIVNLYIPQKGIYWYVLGIAMTIVLSLISFYYVEKPFLAIRRKFGSNAR